MAAALNVLKVVSGILSIASFAQDFLPKEQDEKSTVKMGIALDHNGHTGAGGDLPDVRLWNEEEHFIGMATDPGSVGAGDTGTITVDQGQNGNQAPFALFSANDDAICVAYVSITWPDKSKYAWLGDWGQTCGGTWYHSDLYVNNDNYKPKCLWIDGDGNQPQTGFSLHFPSFVVDGHNKPSWSNSTLCASHSTFQLHYEQDPHAIALGPTLNSRGAPNKPVKKPASNLYEGHLVISKDISNHRTAELCGSETSSGPDFLNTEEGLFCNMKDKTLWPVCSHTDDDDCFDTETKQLIQKGVNAETIGYHTVNDWTVNQA